MKKSFALMMSLLLMGLLLTGSALAEGESITLRLSNNQPSVSKKSAYGVLFRNLRRFPLAPMGLPGGKRRKETLHSKASESAAHVAGFGWHLEGFSPPNLPKGFFDSLTPPSLLKEGGSPYSVFFLRAMPILAVSRHISPDTCSIARPMALELSPRSRWGSESASATYRGTCHPGSSAPSSPEAPWPFWDQPSTRRYRPGDAV